MLNLRLRLIENGVQSAIGIITKTVVKLEKSIEQYEQAQADLVNEMDKARAMHQEVTFNLNQTRKVAENFKNLLK